MWKPADAYRLMQVVLALAEMECITIGPIVMPLHARHCSKRHELCLLNPCSPMSSSEGFSLNFQSRNPRPRERSDLAEVTQSSLFFFLIILLYLFILGCSGSSLLQGPFSSCGEQGPLSSCCMRASHCDGFSCCRAWALELLGFSNCCVWD